MEASSHLISPEMAGNDIMISFPFTAKGMDDQEVLKAAKSTEELLTVCNYRIGKDEHRLTYATGVLPCHRAWTTRPLRC